MVTRVELLKHLKRIPRNTIQQEVHQSVTTVAVQTIWQRIAKLHAKSENSGQAGTSIRNSASNSGGKGQIGTTSKNSVTRQVDTQETRETKLVDTVPEELSDLLASDSNEGDVITIQAGTGSRCAKVKI